jgi:hypothetical protein
MTDPPLEPLDGSKEWYASGPEPILNDPGTATLMVRLGMAANAIASQLDAGAAQHPTRIVWSRNLLMSLVTTAAFIHEALRLCSENARVLRPLAIEAGLSSDALETMGRLQSGNHPVSKFLDRARNEVGFHWDVKTIAPAVLEFGRNEGIVWEECDGENVVSRLAVEVVSHALFPEIVAQAEPDAMQKAGEQTMALLQDAASTLIQYQGACVYRYYEKAGIVRKRREE